ncbi:MAG: hypothetical protein OXE81_02495 [Gammaproteobacteria bacterium]|nr:hypothetical protein [Gammaproteobacteria bacterium]
MAGPVAAQNAVTAPGLSGDSACGGGYSRERNSLYVGYRTSDITNTNLPFSLSNLTDWTNLRSSLGIGDNPVSSITISAKVINTRTGMTVRTLNPGTVTSSQNPSYATTNVTLVEKTPYVAIMYTDYSGHGESNPFSVRCFMTGGTYTIENSGSSNFIMNLWNTTKRDAELSAECTLEGQLGTDSEIRARATTNLETSLGMSGQAYVNARDAAPAACRDRCSQTFPHSDNASRAARTECESQCSNGGIPTWTEMLNMEVAAIKRTFDPGKCRAPEADQPQTNGCYSISPRTPLDVKNCLCGRSPQPAGAGCRTP